MLVFHHAHTYIHAMIYIPLYIHAHHPPRGYMFFFKSSFGSISLILCTTVATVFISCGEIVMCVLSLISIRNPRFVAVPKLHITEFDKINGILSLPLSSTSRMCNSRRTCAVVSVSSKTNAFRETFFTSIMRSGFSSSLTTKTNKKSVKLGWSTLLGEFYCRKHVEDFEDDDQYPCRCFHLSTIVEVLVQDAQVFLRSLGYTQRVSFHHQWYRGW